MHAKRRHVDDAARWQSALAAFAVALAANAGIVVQDPSAAEYWQAASNLSDPLVWCWDDADTAELVYEMPGSAPVTNTVVRGAGEVSGSFALPAPAAFASGRACLFDVSLRLLAGGSETYAASARIAYFPESMELLRPGTSGWRKVKTARVFHYEVGESPFARTVSSKSRVVERGLPATGVFDAVVPERDVIDFGAFTLSVVDGGSVVLSAGLQYPPDGFMIHFN